MSHGTRMWARLSKEMVVEPTIDTISLFATAAVPPQERPVVSQQAFGGANFEGAPAPVSSAAELSFTAVVPMATSEEQMP